MEPHPDFSKPRDLVIDLRTPILCYMVSFTSKAFFLPCWALNQNTIELCPCPVVPVAFLVDEARYMTKTT